MKDNKEEIFIKYANASTKERPATFQEIFDDFGKKCDFVGISSSQLSNIVKYLKKIDRDPNRAKQQYKRELAVFRKAMLNERAKKLGYGDISDFRLAYYTVHNKRCEPEGCNLGDYRHLIGEELLNGPNRIKCDECYHLFFVRILEEVVQGVEYSQIGQPGGLT